MPGTSKYTWEHGQRNQAYLRKRSEASGTKPCECGCGEAIPRISVRGTPQRFVHGHSRRVPLEERFLAKIEFPTDSDCWLWTGSRDKKGYGCLKAGDRSVKAHRVAYELTDGPIPEGLEIHHLCNVPRCVNPDHVEAIVPADHYRRTGEHRRARRPAS